jgi:hypothetical protein
VKAIKIAAVVMIDDADAVDCQHGEDEALESVVVQDATSKRRSAVTKEHDSEAAPYKSLLAVDGMVGGSASFSRSCATKRSSAVTKEHGSEAAPDKSLLAVDGMVGGYAYFSRSCATKRSSAVTKEHGKSLLAVDGMVRA